MPTSGPTVQRVVLAVHPHPDDESIACGGVLARYAEAGVATAVVTCTGGEEGDNLAGIDLGGRPLWQVRQHELQAALEVLGVDVHHHLGYRDSGMAGTAGNEHPDSFHRADLDEAARRLAVIIRELRPHVVISDDPTGTYGHPDHVKSNRVTARATELAADRDAEVPGDPWTVPRRLEHTLSRPRLVALHRALLDRGLTSPFGEPDVDVDDLPFGTPAAAIAFRVDVTPWLERKRQAILAHTSQLAVDSFFLNVPDELAEAMFGLEEFTLAAGAPATDSGDLLAGLPSGQRPCAG